MRKRETRREEEKGTVGSLTIDRNTDDENKNDAENPSRKG